MWTFENWFFSPQHICGFPAKLRPVIAARRTETINEMAGRSSCGTTYRESDDGSHRCRYAAVTVEGDAFKHLNFADPAAAAHRHEPKMEKYLRTTTMPATYDKVALRVHNLFSKVGYVSFTTDSWSNASKSCSLLSFTAHFLHQSARQKVILAAMVLEQDHTGAYLAS